MSTRLQGVSGEQLAAGRYYEFRESRQARVLPRRKKASLSCACMLLRRSLTCSDLSSSGNVSV
jgi:hypothetical protein